MITKESVLTVSVLIITKESVLTVSNKLFTSEGSSQLQKNQF